MGNTLTRAQALHALVHTHTHTRVQTLTWGLHSHAHSQAHGATPSWRRPASPAPSSASPCPDSAPPVGAPG